MLPFAHPPANFPRPRRQDLKLLVAVDYAVEPATAASVFPGANNANNNTLRLVSEIQLTLPRYVKKDGNPGSK